LGAAPVSVVSDAVARDGQILLSTFMDRAGEKITGTLDLRCNEGLIAAASI
jgi:alpha-glucosidase